MDDLNFDPAPKGYLFDMDGLLLDTERVGLQAFLTVCEGYGIARVEAEPFFLSLIGGSQKVNAAKAEAYLAGRADVMRFGAEWNAQKHALMQADVPLRPYVREVIEGLSASGMRMAVVTSTLRDAAQHELKRAAILQHFVAVIAGDEVTANKPDPAPYLQGAAALGLDPKDCAAFEDSDTGITAAMRAGCRAVQIPDLRPDVPLPDLGQMVARNLKEAVAMVSPVFARGFD